MGIINNSKTAARLIMVAGALFMVSFAIGKHTALGALGVMFLAIGASRLRQLKQSNNEGVSA